MKKKRLPGKADGFRGMPFIYVLRTMKLTAIIMLVACLQASATAYSQTKITLSTKRMHLVKVLQAIEAQGHVRFVYNNDVLPNNEFISIDVTDQPVEVVLSKVLKNTDLTFRALDKELIVIAPAAAVIKNIPVKGKITDEKGNPIPGVNIQIAGTTKGTVTTATGTYQLDVPDDATLLFTFVGYVQQTIAVNNRTTIDVVLKEDTKGLNEVVVVGYGTQKKVNLTGSVATVTADKLASRPVTSVQNALQGLVPGLTILNRPGDVGKDVGSVSVRGRTNLSAAGSSPMYIIDGIPSTASDMATINPNDIESMSVLKDASSAAIYGSRAANGVILIATKRGKEGKMSVDVNASYGLTSPTRTPDFLGSADYARLRNEAITNDGGLPLYSEEQIRKFADGSDPDHYPNTDWYKEALRKNPAFKDIQIGVSGSSKNTTYYLSMAYQNQQSLVPTKTLDRYAVRLNTSSQVLPILNIGTNVAFVKQDINNRGDEMNFTEMNRTTPTLVARHTDGSWGTINAGQTDATFAKNNVVWNNQLGGRNWDKNNAFTGGINGTLTPLKGLSVKGLASLKLDNRTANRFWNTMAPLVDFDTKAPLMTTARTINRMQEKWSQRQALLLQAFAEYERTFHKQHYTKIMLGASQESNVYRNVGVGRRNFPSNNLGTVGAGGGTADDALTTDDDQLTDFNIDRTKQSPNGSYSEVWAIRSYFGRINYAFADKYLLEANMRFDLSSRFHPDYRLAKFPSVSAGWRISEEAFMKKISWIDNLKLRGSWGILGNESVVPLGNYYEYIGTYPGAYSFDGNVVDGAYQENAANLSTSWEKVYMTNVGFDGSFFQGKLDVTLDYFVKRTEGILIKRPLSDDYGLKPALINAGATRNKGIELMLSYHNKIGKDFTYNISGNMSKITNRIIDMGGVDDNIHDTYYIDRVGESVGSFYGYEALGLFADDNDVKNNAGQKGVVQKPGDIKFKDQNNDGVIDGKDRVVIGNEVPWLTYGINLNLGYKGIDFGIITYGVTNVKTYLGQEASNAFFNGGKVKAYHLGRWTKENPDPNAVYPRLSEVPKVNNNPISSFWLFKGDYFRIRAITLGYTLPKQWAKKAAMQSARIYLAANNPFTFMFDKRLTDYDPEMASGRGSYPGVKTWAVGVNVKF
ncbi:TonB-dependent receptor [Chitinophaga nivalis]|uniref:TonB-dependent receptor n=1 Tax=Chitinophaga nivalis TaxID=2991709 RepID=A0ABT3IW38_9BACT|nr:TonB-dependent receptor [Chitinophaga nivalis]MCW3462107.1 TonB-dependent receptor [Chitinophaga nivalis]MCW3488201.1 TonB-dependent receptor [Chitinophaga nivalis]